jgi:hypothetical protein
MVVFPMEIIVDGEIDSGVESRRSGDDDGTAIEGEEKPLGPEIPAAGKHVEQLALRT